MDSLWVFVCDSFVGVVLCIFKHNYVGRQKVVNSVMLCVMNHQFVPNVRKKVYKIKIGIDHKQQNRILTRKERREDKRKIRTLKELIDDEL